ncbi:MAG: TauD/TfdA family dioxygenase [Hoeflea sp. D1-CHI-28]
MAIKITPLETGMGARVTEIDLRTPANDADFAAIQDALDTHLLLSFPDQQIDAPQQVAFAKRFGPLDIHVLEQYNHPEYPEIFMLSNEVVDGKPLGMSDAGSYWHSDFAFRPQPAYTTMLHAKKIPSRGGNTVFADTYAAYDALDAETRNTLIGRRAVQRYRKRSDTLGKGTGVNMTSDQEARTPDVAHPLIRAHPKTGRNSIFAPIGTTAEIQGLPADESAEILKMLFGHIIDDRFVSEYSWTVGDLVFWDNRFTQHKATSDQLSGDESRTLFRTTSMGEVPIMGKER